MKNFNFDYRFLVLFIPLLMSLGRCTEASDYNKLEELLEKANLIFYEPKEYQLVPIIKNKQVRYSFAYKIKTGIEIRYSIWPYNENFNQDQHGSLAFFSSFVFNISKKPDSPPYSNFDKIKPFPTNYVQNEFNAEFGAYAFCDLDPEFGQEYQKCFIFMTQKNNCGMVVCYWLFKDNEHKEEYLKNINDYKGFVNSLKFYKSTPPMDEHPKGIKRVILKEDY